MIRTRVLPVLLSGAIALGAWAQDDAAEPGLQAVPQVSLDDLLGLPTGYEAAVQRRAGATESEWRGRFAASLQQLEEAKQRLAKSEEELDKVSELAPSWQVAPPGSSNPQTSPLSLRLRDDVKRQRQAVELAGRDLRELEVQAELASVPDEWRQ